MRRERGGEGGEELRRLLAGVIIPAPGRSFPALMRPPGTVAARIVCLIQEKGETNFISEFGPTHRSGITFEGHLINLSPSLHEIVFACHFLSRWAQLGSKSSAITFFITPSCL